METAVADPELASALDAARAAVRKVAQIGAQAILDGRDAIAVIEQTQGLQTQVHSFALELQGEIDRRGLHKADGHNSAKVMYRYCANLSDREALRRAKAVRALRDLPLAAAAHRAGTLGPCQVDRIARSHANKRIRALVIDSESVLVELGQTLPYRDFDAVVTDWERVADQDGADQKAERTHKDRNATIVTDFEGTTRLNANCGTLQGAELLEIFRRYIEAEFHSDWAQARHAHGIDTTVDHLARTDAQRRMDALHKIFTDAASQHASQPGGSMIVTNIVIDEPTFEARAAQFAGAPPVADNRVATHLGDALNIAKGHPPVDTGIGFRCSTPDGIPIDPTHVTAHALTGHIRRVVTNAAQVITNLGRLSRLFTGPAALAAKLGNTTCYWGGCNNPVSTCQIDHLRPWGGPDPGPTDQDNAGPACPKHNRFKQGGFTVTRDPAGNWHTYRPDGTEI